MSREDLITLYETEVGHIDTKATRSDDRAYGGIVRARKGKLVDDEIVLGIECKTYAENAMLKRILVDFNLLKVLHFDLTCCLLQLESMLGGHYAHPLASPQLGSPSSHVLMSLFPNVRLNVVTLLEGERKVTKPIHKKEFFKPMKLASLDRAIEQFGTLLRPHA